MKKIIQKFGGYASPFTIFLVVVILVISGFYGWQKYQEKMYPEKAARGEIKGISYYYYGIKGQVNKIFVKLDVKNKRAVELAERTKTVTDKAGYFSIEVPESWVISENLGTRGNELSRITAQSSYFSSWKNDATGFAKIDAGAKFTGLITRGENRKEMTPSGGHKNIKSTEHDFSIKGQNCVLHNFSEPESSDGEMIDCHMVYNGNTYLFRMEYSPRSFTNAEYTFKEILDSLVLLK